MENKYQEICQNFEKLEAKKLIVEEKLVQSENKNQQLNQSNEELDQVKEKHQASLKNVEELKAAHIVIYQIFFE